MSEPIPDLDDFFAKKDRKKSKKKFPTNPMELKKEVSTSSTLSATNIGKYSFYLHTALPSLTQS